MVDMLLGEETFIGNGWKRKSHKELGRCDGNNIGRIRREEKKIKQYTWTADYHYAE